MTKANGFLQLRRGLWEHLRDGRMSHMDALAFIYIVSQADTRTGVWNGSASSLAGEIVVSPRNARRLLERLSAAGYLKRFSVPGKHICYPILVHKYPISDGEHKGEHLDAANSTSPTLLQYKRAKTGEQECEHKGEQKASQKILDTRDKRQRPAAKTAPPADPRHKEAFDSCFEAYRVRFGVVPTWAGREAKTLQGFLREHSSIPAEEIARRYRNLLDSTDRWHGEKHGSLAHLLSNFDVFADGPILAAPQKGGSDGKPRINPEQRTRDNLRAAGLLN